MEVHPKAPWSNQMRKSGDDVYSRKSEAGKRVEDRSSGAKNLRRLGAYVSGYFRIANISLSDFVKIRSLSRLAEVASSRDLCSDRL